MKQKQHAYGIYFPRNIANEYVVYRIAPDRRKAWEQFEKNANNNNQNAHRITRREAEKRTSAKWIAGYSYFGGRTIIVDF